MNKNCAPGSSGIGRYCGLSRVAKFWIVVRTYRSNKQEPMGEKGIYWNGSGIQNIDD